MNIQIQTIVGDLKSQELFALLQRDRANAKTSTKNQIAYRMQAEGVLGGNENLYKIEWVGLLDIHKKMNANDECQVTRQGDAYYPALERRGSFCG